MSVCSSGGPPCSSCWVALVWSAWVCGSLTSPSNPQKTCSNQSRLMGRLGDSETLSFSSWLTLFLPNYPACSGALALWFNQPRLGLLKMLLSVFLRYHSYSWFWRVLMGLVHILTAIPVKIKMLKLHFEKYMFFLGA